jgi:hypothetical protein
MGVHIFMNLDAVRTFPEAEELLAAPRSVSGVLI